ncbi:hypothetical protein BKA61DRAFT_139292 [Leptodontidium sp. MPI-SDFR-AT-0119]|nr:hypothetical protein BKA61DRAFT_139292 [Leptodontidium sp. MPI-SDFR-AT-0119]
MSPFLLSVFVSVSQVNAVLCFSMSSHVHRAFPQNTLIFQSLAARSVWNNSLFIFVPRVYLLYCISQKTIFLDPSGIVTPEGLELQLRTKNLSAEDTVPGNWYPVSWQPSLLTL